MNKRLIMWVNIYHTFYVRFQVDIVRLQRMKTANYYKTRGYELDKSMLRIVPDAPRVPFSGLPPNYDWNMFDSNNVATPYEKNNVRKLHHLLSLSISLILLTNFRIISWKKVIQPMKVSLNWMMTKTRCDVAQRKHWQDVRICKHNLYTFLMFLSLKFICFVVKAQLKRQLQRHQLK